MASTFSPVTEPHQAGAPQTPSTTMPPQGLKYANVVALMNPKSGERASAVFLYDELERLLPGKVCDLSKCFQDQTPAVQLITDHCLTTPPGTIIVAGGDGTVSFVMDILRTTLAAQPAGTPSPFVSIIPMGTGNDLSRALGFGGGFSHVICCCGCSGCCRVHTIDDVVDKCISGTTSDMDRWSLTIVDAPHLGAGGAAAADASTGASTSPPPPPSSASASPPPAGATVLEQRLMNNYFSIGFDAHVAHRFDTFRHDHPSLCQSRMMNKVWYGFLGVRALCGDPELNDLVQLYVDDVLVPLPDGSKSLVVSNVNSYAGGMTMWNDSRNRFPPPLVNDGLLEVQVMFGTTHMSLMHIHLRSGFKVCQGRRIRMLVSTALFMQFDGEPLRNALKPCQIDIAYHSKPLVRRIPLTP